MTRTSVNSDWLMSWPRNKPIGEAKIKAKKIAMAMQDDFCIPAFWKVMPRVQLTGILWMSTLKDRTIMEVTSLNTPTDKPSMTLCSTRASPNVHSASF